MDAQLLAPLTQLTALSQSLFLSLSQQPSQKQVPPPPLSSFAAVDAELQTALTTVSAHQRRQARIVALQQELLDVDARWRTVCEALEEGRKVLEEIVREGDERVECIRKAKEAAIPYPELLAYAQSLSAFTSAPPGLTMPEPGAVGPVPLFFPPFPNEEKMRRGRLNVERPLGGLGENHSVRGEWFFDNERILPIVGALSARDCVLYLFLAPIIIVSQIKQFWASHSVPSPEPSPPPVQTRERPGVNPYRHDTRPQLAVFDLDLDLNPDL